MAFQSYITYEEYVELGGTMSEETFNIQERKAQRWLDEFTFNRLQKMCAIPDVVKDVLVEFMSKLSILESQRSDGNVVTQYSNGVESFTYSRKSEDTLRKELQNTAIDWLPDYLVCRSVNFDVRKYLQSDCNNPQ